ncbi:MAG: response regulator, partial [Deferribacterales bacterium]|nr:response regulator [Deferribacterales bacterium]
NAHEKLKEYFPLIDIAVIDIKMPGMTGGKLYETIKERYGHLPAIFISGYENDDEIKDIKNNFSFLKKPFSSDDLVNEINKNLKVDNKWMK